MLLKRQRAQLFFTLELLEARSCQPPPDEALHHDDFTNLFLVESRQNLDVEILKKNFGFSQRPTVHFQSDQQKSARLSVRHNTFTERIRKEAVALQKVTKGQPMRESVLTNANRLENSSVAKLLQYFGSVKAFRCLNIIWLNASSVENRKLNYCRHRIFVNSHKLWRSRNNSLQQIHQRESEVSGDSLLRSRLRRQAATVFRQILQELKLISNLH